MEELSRYVPPVAFLVLLLIGIFGLMRWSWRRRADRQSGQTGFYEYIAGGKAATGRQIGFATYVATTIAPSTLDRVTAYGLGMRARVGVSDVLDASTPLVTIDHPGRHLDIPWSDVEAVFTAPGMIGKWMGGEALIIIRWNLGGTLLDTGLRFETDEGHDLLLSIAESHGVLLTADEPDPSSRTTSSESQEIA